MAQLPRTRLVDVGAMREILASMGLDEFTRRLVDRLEADFRRWPEFDKSPRAAAHSELGVIELMPTADGRYYSFKYVNGHPANFRLGMPTVMAFGVLSDVRTGWPILVSEMTLLTALRTAATSAMAAKLLARPDARTMAMIGCGAQAEFQIRAFRAILGIETFRIFDLDSAAMDKVVRNLPDFSVERAASVADAVRGADIVTTSTADKARAVVLSDGMVEPGVHLNAIGGDCPGKTELDPRILDRARIFAEFLPQTRIEGEIQQRPSAEVTELWEVLTGARPGRTSAEDVTLFDSVGFAVEDYSSLVLVHEEATRLGVGSEIALVPPMADVKNLYAELSA